MFTKNIFKTKNMNLLGQRRFFGYTTLYANTNQAQGLAEYAIDFLK
jgi:hypothetical protein